MCVLVVVVVVVVISLGMRGSGGWHSGCKGVIVVM